MKKTRSSQNDLEAFLDSFEFQPPRDLVPGILAEAGISTSTHRAVPSCILPHIMQSLGDESTEMVDHCVAGLRSLWHLGKDALHQYFQSCVANPLSLAKKRTLLAHLTLPDQQVTVCAYNDFAIEIKPEQVLSLIQDGRTQIYPLIDTPKLRVFAARVPSSVKHLKALLLRADDRDHFLVVNQALQGNDFLESLWHEFEHVLSHRSGSRLSSHVQSKEGASMHIPKFVPFAIAQMNIDSEDKALVARWVETEIPLRSGAGIFLDAGSSCLAVWKEIVEAIRNNRYSNLTVYTSSLMVLQSWSEQQIVPQLLGTNLVLAGDEFDAPHLAFYGAAVTRKLLDGDFRPFSVYIGVSGIDFDDGIFLGYHAGDLEKQAKEALFRCPAKTRVILATPAKIGNAGGRVFNLLAMKGLDTRGSIYLVTTSPEPGTEEEKRFNKAREVFLGDGVQHALRAAGVQFSWIILDRNAKETPKALERLVGPRELTHDLK